MSWTWRSTCCAIGWCCRSRPSPTTSIATLSCARSSIGCPSPSSRCDPMTASAPAPERMLQGDYRSLFRGNGVDFADLREYEYGDDVRHIDWNVTARMGTPYIREFLEDREITAW